MTKQNKGIGVSVVITAHNEGILAHKTMLSVFRAARELELKKITYEIIVHIDNGTQQTVDYFARYKNDDRVRILTNSFGDLSSSRNYAIEHARGEYITCLDADDLYSSQWLVGAYAQVSKDHDTIARMQYIITFGGVSVITENRDMDADEATLHLLVSNSYSSVFMCAKHLYEACQQRKNVDPYGFEDWQWTLDTMAAGFIHKVVPGTALFYRRDPLMKPSLLAAQSTVRRTLSPTDALSFDAISKIDISKESLPIQQGKAGLRDGVKEKVYHALTYANTFKTYRTIKQKIRPNRDTPSIVLPDWLLQEWKAINKIEKSTFPSDYILKEAIEWYPNKDVGMRYARIVQALSRQPDTLFFVPWLIRGGADKVFINTANEIGRIHPEWRLAVMQTYPHSSLWQDKLSSDIDFVDIADILQGINYEDQMSLVAMFVSQNNIKRIMIGNSRFAYNFVLRYKNLIRHLDIKVYAFAFTETINIDGRVGDFIHEDIPYVQDVTYRIVTDNTSIVNQLYTEHAIPKEKVFVHHQFLSNTFCDAHIKKQQPLRILWASRINTQKIPDVLKKISQRMGDDFQIDAYGQLENHYTSEFFNDSGVDYIRAFNGIDDLPVEKYDVFLYTSNADGMPNILLEIASKGLPIIAPDVGGVKDFIKDKQTGLLVSDCLDEDQYIKALEAMRDDTLRLKLVQNAQELLRTNFDKASWRDGIKRIFNE